MDIAVIVHNIKTNFSTVLLSNVATLIELDWNNKTTYTTVKSELFKVFSISTLTELD